MAAKSLRELVGASPSTASLSDSTLLIIDAQNEYAEGHLKTHNVESTRQAISSLLEKYRSAGRSENIVHIVHQTPEGAPIFTTGTRLAAEFDELAPQPGEKTIVKKFPGSFTGTDLEEHLRAIGAKKVVLAGYMAHVCVSTTARQADEKGLDVIVAREAVGDRDIPGIKAEQLVEAALAELGDAFGTIVSVHDIK